MYGDAYPLGPETDLWRLFAKNLPTRTYEKDQMIYWQEEQADCFYCIKKGRVKVFLSSENGMEKTITIVEQGIFISLLQPVRRSLRPRPAGHRIFQLKRDKTKTI